MRRIKAVVEYDGSNYHGFQRQEGLPTVQQALENALQSLCGKPTAVVVSGRTDHGVHAIGQVIHFDINQRFTDAEVLMGLNYYLHDEDVAVLDVIEVSDDFSARFDAKKRHYMYRIINRVAPLKLEKLRAWHVKQRLDIDKMREGAAYMIGKHDFQSFRATACQAKTSVRSIDSIEIVCDGEIIEIYIKAQSFLHNQIRIIAGTLKNIGVGKLEPQAVQEILEARDRRKAPETAPPHGLYFMRVDYS